ncbi:hypothetical protein TRFO_42670 [Tritrichomonas foetus]|uniref:Uncharacterized protein n=1 Tax=Tritrichomonas foetus TaxID=1144522 RepID=A0A1J4KVE5_9EUKA|nr:hypothetical protein TRFO_42670 [Tritrichomonas foetus]|eukprot:OHT15207.1 hypothetical protein TRFO_42670 [Tritrichomonas foetus]
MLWILLILSSTFHGYCLVPLVKVGSLDFLARFFTGWFLGSIGTGLFLYIISLLIPISAFLTIIIIAIHTGSAFFLLKHSHKSKIAIDSNPWFLFLIVFTAGMSLRYLGQIYSKIPDFLPYLMEPIYEDEISFINSLFYGNNRRRSNIMYYDNPRASTFKYPGYATPLLYAASLMTLGASYSDASIIICFLNTMAACYGVYSFAKKYTKWATITTIIFLFSGSWAAHIYYRASNRNDITNDLVHQFTPTHSSVWFQPFAVLLSMSKSSSFSIPMSIFAVNWAPSLISPILTTLIPSVTTSFATFGLLSGIPHCLPQILPFAASLIIRLVPFIFEYRPLFREAEMRGTFFAPLIIWFIAIGPVFLVVFFFGWLGLLQNIRLRNYCYASLGPFLLLQFFREGTDHFANAVAITAISLPATIVLFVELMRRFSQFPKDEEYKGVTIFIMTFTFAFLLYGGYLTINRIPMSTTANTVHRPLFNMKDHELTRAMIEKIPNNAVVFIKSRRLHPIIHAGKTAFLGDKHLIWATGIKFQDKYSLIDEMINENATAEAFQKAGVSFIVEEGLRGFGLNQRIFKTIFQNSQYKILAV